VRANVRVGGGVFFNQAGESSRRVFDDVNRNGQFDSADKPVAGARLYLTNGQSVITDSQGLYNSLRRRWLASNPRSIQ